MPSAAALGLAPGVHQVARGAHIALGIRAANGVAILVNTTGGGGGQGAAHLEVASAEVGHAGPLEIDDGVASTEEGTHEVEGRAAMGAWSVQDLGESGIAVA